MRARRCLRASRDGGENVTTIELLLIVGLVLVLTPWVVFTSVKLGAYGYLRGRELFHLKEKLRNGETQTTEDQREELGRSA